MAKSIIDIIENNGGLCTEGIIDAFIESIEDGEKPTLLIDDIISNIENHPATINLTLQPNEVREAAEWYLNQILEHKEYKLCRTGDAEDYIDFIRCKTIEEYDKRRIR